MGDLYYPLRPHHGTLSVVAFLEVTRWMDVRADGMDDDAVSAWLRELMVAAASCYFPVVLYETRNDQPWVSWCRRRHCCEQPMETLRWLRLDEQERSGRTTVASLNSAFRLSRQSARVLDDMSQPRSTRFDRRRQTRILNCNKRNHRALKQHLVHNHADPAQRQHNVSFAQHTAGNNAVQRHKAAVGATHSPPRPTRCPPPCL